MNGAWVSTLAVALAVPYSLLQPPAAIGPLSADTVIVGQVGRADGSVASATSRVALGARKGNVAGAEVKLVWLPGLAEAKQGARITPVVVSTSRSDAQGKFALKAKPSPAMLREATRNNGWVNFDVVAESPTGESTTRQLSRAWLGGAWTTKGRSDLPASLDLAYAYDGTGRLLNGSAKASDAAAVTATAYGCQYVIDTTWVQSTRVALFHTSSNADGSWQYGATADSDIDTGSNPYGAAGWTVSGSYHVGNSSTAYVRGSTSAEYHKWVRTDFRYQRGHVRDYFGAPAGSICSGTSMRVGDERTSAQHWAGGIGDDAGAGSYNRGCIQQPMGSYANHYPRGTELYLGSSRATRIGWVVGLPFMNLGGTSGYSTNMDMAWKVLRGNGVWLCGVTGDVTRTPGVVYSQNVG
jgi:hypothetical protein